MTGRLNVVIGRACWEMGDLDWKKKEVKLFEVRGRRMKDEGEGEGENRGRRIMWKKLQQEGVVRDECLG